MANFSKNPDAVLQDALTKGYNRVLFQQGKPVLDRELNLLADLVSPQRLIEHHIGNGVPEDNDGFRISNLDTAQNDFTIQAGRCLVGGFEIVLSSDTTYKTQPHTANVAPLPAGTGYVYLRVFTSEVDHTEDGDLSNPSGPNNPDVGFETAVRKKVEWEVIVTTSGVTAQNHMLLAVITKTPPTVTDRRRTGLTVSHLRDELVAARGTQASLDARLDVSLNENGTVKSGVVGDMQVKTGAGITENKLAFDKTAGHNHDGVNSKRITHADVGALSVSGGTVAGDLVVNGKLGVGTATVPNAKVVVNGPMNSLGLSVNDGSNTGVGRGLWLWSPTDSNHVIYSANPGGKSPADKNASAGYFDSGHRLRLRTATGQGFLFENSAESALVDIDSDNGRLWTKGALYAGNSDIYFTKTDHTHSGIGNGEGFAAVENAAAPYNALMILGRNMGTSSKVNRVVKLWDYLQVNGTLEVTGEINCPSWKVTRVIQQVAGPLPKSGSFTSGGGTLIVFAFGSGYANVAGRTIGMQINAGGMMMGEAKVFTNESSSHKSFVGSPIVITSLKAGTYSVDLYRLNVDTLTDGNDFFNVIVMEVPFR